MITKKQEEKILDVFAYVEACRRLDCEANLCGNGTNSSEASNLVDEILNILGKPNIEKRIKKELKKLKEQGYGDDY